jgi:hypothetical protein
MALVGDAAGYVTKSSGEGIYFAAKSGRMCAEQIVESSQAGQKVPTEAPIGPSEPPPNYGDLAVEISALPEDFRHPSGSGCRVPAGDDEKAVLHAFLDRIYPHGPTGPGAS